VTWGAWLEAAQNPSGLATLLTAVAAILALWFNGYQIRRSRLATDLQALTDFNSGMNERERALASAKAKGADEQRFAFNEFMNFLEFYAFVDNTGMLVRSSRSLMRDKIADSLAGIELMGWNEEVERSKSTMETFKEIERFRQRHGALIEKGRLEMKRKLTEK
jgi:hypothetical protein